MVYFSIKFGLWESRENCYGGSQIFFAKENSVS